MSILKSVRLKGVWGERDLDCTFRPDINFLIGPNGSGKTTVINLLAATLSGDYEALTRIPFASIECELSPKEESQKGPRILVERVENEVPAPVLNYSVYLADGKKQFELFPSTTLAYRVRLHSRLRGYPGLEALMATLNEIVHVKWLSVYRSPGKGDPEDRSRGESSVDRRLSVLNNQLVRHFSKLAGLKEAATNHFLSRVFLALIYKGEKAEPINAREVNLKKLREAMEAIFHRFEIDDEKSMSELKEFMDLAQQASRKPVYNWSELQNIVGVLPISKVVEEWNATLLNQEEILRPQNDFLQIINSMIKGKHMAINQRNELEVILDGQQEKRLQLSDLSSGEKQLLIIFGEALLQDRTEFVYIADEPELSLHVSWQEHLIANLRKINPNAQVIFATHSPDIVSQYGDRVISMAAE